MATTDLTALLGLLLGVLSFIGGLILWYKGTVEKRYAAERDFGHIRRNQEQLLQNIGQLNDDLDEMSRTLIELKAYTLGISNRLEGLAARVEGGATGGWSRSNLP